MTSEFRPTERMLRCRGCGLTTRIPMSAAEAITWEGRHRDCGSGPRPIPLCRCGAPAHIDCDGRLWCADCLGAR